MHKVGVEQQEMGRKIAEEIAMAETPHNRRDGIDLALECMETLDQFILSEGEGSEMEVVPIAVHERLA